MLIADLKGEVMVQNPTPTTMIQVLAPFVPLFSKRLWQRARMLLMGAILAPSERTVVASLRVMGLGHTRRFERYHRVLNRANWSGREAARSISGCSWKLSTDSAQLAARLG